MRTTSLQSYCEEVRSNISVLLKYRDVSLNLCPLFGSMRIELVIAPWRFIYINVKLFISSDFWFDLIWFCLIKVWFLQEWNVSITDKRWKWCLWQPAPQFCLNRWIYFVYVMSVYKKVIVSLAGDGTTQSWRNAKSLPCILLLCTVLRMNRYENERAASWILIDSDVKISGGQRTENQSSVISQV